MNVTFCYCHLVESSFIRRSMHACADMSRLDLNYYNTIPTLNILFIEHNAFLYSFKEDIPFMIMHVFTVSARLEIVLFTCFPCLQCAHSCLEQTLSG